ncbi:hypothetical protein PBV87_15435 [Niameybacter massiliensis]|uniref:Uncharacterized protein n=1 Tax=Holtiella tumoricola TaxID=3018743 RepID=A0AA42DPI6_9FIRM|nr:hypothetical protein [Holtiella tumoricola]MDA3732869.1 hypothetical protein [Holtiella tumoricola]
MTEKKFFRVTDIMELMDVSRSSAYKLMQKLNKELEEQGKATYSGRLSKKYFYERVYID